MSHCCDHANVWLDLNWEESAGVVCRNIGHDRANARHKLTMLQLLKKILQCAPLGYLLNTTINFILSKT
jgi:hypothetical protein